MREPRVTGLRESPGASNLSPGRKATRLWFTVCSVLGSTPGMEPVAEPGRPRAFGDVGTRELLAQVSEQLTKELSPRIRQMFPSHVASSPLPTEPRVLCVCFVFRMNIFLAAPSRPPWLTQPSRQPEGRPHGSHGILGPSGHLLHPSLTSRSPSPGEGRCGATEPFSRDAPSLCIVAVLLVPQGSAGGSSACGIREERSWGQLQTH